jgi:4-hydroxybenzoate polyprenyltransferase
MLSFFRLIRLPNLIIIALTQYFMRFFIIKPMLEHFSMKVSGIYQMYKLELQMSELDFLLLVLATLFLTAAGYIINDYFDRRIDQVNKPEKVVVGKTINRRTAMTLHWIFNLFGVVLGFYVSWKIGIYKLGFIFLIITGILWYYTTSYKKQFLIGNFVVAFLTALVPLMVILYELPLLNKFYSKIIMLYEANFYGIFMWIATFSAFAFLTTLIREIVKDTEDFEGDSMYGGNTVPIIAGIGITKTILVVLSIFTISAITYLYFTYLNDWLSGIYIGVTIVLPFLVFIIIVLKANTQKHYGAASLLMKVIMLFGIFYSLIVNYIINNI